MAESMAEMIKAEGKAEGREEGRAEGQQSSILTILRSRFETLPVDVDEKVQAITDSVHLQRLLSSALDAETFDDIDWHATNGQETE